jgi:two-component system, LytTR family, sensor kinase
MQRLIKDLSWPSTAIDRISIETIWGHIAVEGYDGPNIQLILTQGIFNRARPDQQLSELGIELDENGRTLRFRHNQHGSILSWLQHTDVRYLLQIPRGNGIEVDLKSNFGHIQVNDFLGALNASTNTGNIKLRHVRGEGQMTAQLGQIKFKFCKGDYAVRTFAGNITVSDGEGQLDMTADLGAIRVSNFSGKMYASASMGSVRARQVNGDLRVNTPLGATKITESQGSLRANTNWGSIRAEFTELTGPIQIESSSGNVNLQLPLSVGLDLNIAASQIRSVPLPDFKGESKRTRIVGTSAGGGIPVQINASNGHVKLSGVHHSPLSAVEQNFTNQTFNLPQQFFTWDWKGILLSFVFCLVMTYGISAVIFLSNEQVTNTDMREIYKGIVIGYFLDSILAVLLVGTLANWINERIQPIALQYLVLSAISFLGGFLIKVALALIYWQFIVITEAQLDNGARNSTFYFLVPPIVACILYYFWQRARQITRKISEQEFQLLQMEKMKTSAELDALQARINPHFLYNALNSIAGLVHEDPAKAEKMTLLLSKLFRFTIGTNDQHYNTIAHEVEIARTYLEVEQVRFGSRLSFDLDIQEGLTTHSIPRFLLQPLVENAIKHGISKVAGPGHIGVKIYKEAVFIVCAITDTGPVFEENFFIGYGLKSIQEKLKLLYGDKAFLDIQNQPDKQVIIHIPF